jgi:tetratricopeptide (TPR) repeat protein
MSKNKKMKKGEFTLESSVFNYNTSSTSDKVIYFTALSVVVLHLIGLFVQSPYTWGFNYIRFLSPLLQGFFILFAIFIFIPMGQRVMYFVIEKTIKLKNKIPVYWSYILLIILIGSIFWILRVKVYVLGDASLIYQSVNIDDTEVWTNREMLTTKIVSFINNFFKSSGSVSIINSYVFISLVSGIIFIVTIIEMSRLLGKNDNEKFLIFSFLLFSASSLLFFGYVENYSILYAFISIYFLFAVRYLLNKSSIFYALIFYVIIFLLHMGTLALFPTVLYLLYYEFKKKGRKLLLLLYILITFAVLGILLYFSEKGLVKLINIFSGGWSLVSKNAVPLSLSGSDYSVYTMFSIGHLVDFINHQILLNPLALFLIIFFIFYQSGKISWKEPVFVILFLGTIFSLALSFTFNHIYGMSKDWDVIAPFVITFLLLCLYLMINKLNLLKGKKWILSVVIGVLVFHTIPFILVYSGEEAALSRSKSLQDTRIMPKIGIIVTDMNIAEYYHMKSDYNKVAQTYNTLMERYPYDARGYILLTKTYDLDFKNINKSIEISHLAESRGVYSTKIEYNLGYYYYQKNLLDEANEKWKMAIALDSTYVKAYNYLGIAYAMKNKYDSAIIYLNRSSLLNPNDLTVSQNLGNCYLALGYHKFAIPYLEKYSYSNTMDYANYKNLGLCYKAVGESDKTVIVWKRYLEIAPRSVEYDLISEEVKKMSIK